MLLKIHLLFVTAAVTVEYVKGKERKEERRAMKEILATPKILFASATADVVVKYSLAVSATTTVSYVKINKERNEK